MPSDSEKSEMKKGRHMGRDEEGAEAGEAGGQRQKPAAWPHVPSPGLAS